MGPNGGNNASTGISGTGYIASANVTNANFQTKSKPPKR